MIRVFGVPGFQACPQYLLVEDLSRYLLGKPQATTWVPFRFTRRF